MASPVTENGPTRYCHNCKRDIEHNFELHKLSCHRHTQLCDKCKEPVCKSEMEEHMKNHELVLCKCKMEIEKMDLEMHEEVECSHRMVQCKFCEMSLKGVELEEHEHACGSRTEQCHKCFNYIMIRDSQTHDCSLVKPKQTDRAVRNSGFVAEYLNSSAYQANGLLPFHYDIDSDMIGNIYGSQPRNSSRDILSFDSTYSLDVGTSRDSAAHSKDSQAHPSSRGSHFDGCNGPVVMDGASSRHGPSLATLSGGELSRGSVSRSKQTKGVASGISKDNVTDTFEGLNIHGATGLTVNTTARSKLTSHKQNGTERINIRASKSSSKSNRTAKSRRPDNSVSMGIQARSLQPDGRTQPDFDLDNDAANGGKLKNRRRIDRNKLKKARQTDMTKKETDTLLNQSSGFEAAPIQIEDQNNDDLRSDMHTDSQSNLEARDNIVDEIPCEICEVLVNMNDIEVHQRQCLLEQQEALQTFVNRVPETPPDVIEKIAIDDEASLDSDAIIPCEFCNEVFPVNDCLLHQPYCDKNPNKHSAVDHMEFRSTGTSVPFNGQSAGFWESRYDEQPFSMNIPSFRQRTNPNLFPEFNEEMRNDASDPEDENPAFRSERSPWP